MLAIVAPADVDAVLALCAKWGVLATVVGEVTDTGRLEVDWHGERVVDVPPSSLADEGPVYSRPLARPVWLDDRQASSASALPRPADLRAALLQVVAAPNVCDPSWVTDQYDRYVLRSTVLAQPDDAGLVRLGDGPMGVAMSLDGNGRYAALDPYVGAQLSLVEAARNVAATGSTPAAVTDCLNFGSPEDPEVMWQFAEAVRGIADACRALGLPMTGGNVSFYNQTGDTAINPTVVVGVLGIIDDVATRTPTGFQAAGEPIYLLGATHDELSGSEWAWTAHRHLGGLPPVVDYAAEQALHAVLLGGGLTSAHDLSTGGLAVALTECVLRRSIGAEVTLPGDAFTTLFSESGARALVTVTDGAALEHACAAAGLPCVRLGVTGGDALVVNGSDPVGAIPLDELRAAHTGTLPALFGGAPALSADRA
jgi:phosphoribosylformylglycinamidine synthase